MLENYISIPSSLSLKMCIEDKNLKIKEEAVKERRSFVTCKGCGGKAENDEYESCTYPDGLGKPAKKCRVRVSRCIEKSKCLPYKEILSNSSSETHKDNTNDNTNKRKRISKDKDRENDKEKEKPVSTTDTTVSESISEENSASYKLDRTSVSHYNKLCRVDKEEVSRIAGMSSKYVAFALRRSDNRKLVTSAEKVKLSEAVDKLYKEVVEGLSSKNPIHLQKYPNTEVYDFVKDAEQLKTLEEEMLDVLGPGLSDVNGYEEVATLSPEEIKVLEDIVTNAVRESSQGQVSEGECPVFYVTIDETTEATELQKQVISVFGYDALCFDIKDGSMRIEYRGYGIQAEPQPSNVVNLGISDVDGNIVNLATAKKLVDDFIAGVFD